MQLQSNNPAVVDLAVQVLESVLRQRALRPVYWNTLHAMDALVKILKTESPTPQMQYQVIYCFWILTFDTEIAQELNRYQYPRVKDRRKMGKNERQKEGHRRNVP